jgi:DNA modification methylase
VKNTEFLASKIELWPVESLVPYDRNARTHSDEQVEQIASSIREFGFTNPILVDSSNGIIAGHGRLMAARSIGLEQVPVIVLDHLTDAQRRAYILADNKLALNAGWDNVLLSQELADLQADDFDLSLIGFSDEELAELLPDVEDVESEGDGNEDAVPEAPENPITVLGDIWQLGKHRVMCGDSTSIDAVDQLMAGQQADMIFTDPPYGMSYGGGRSKKAFGMIENDDAQGGDLVRLVADALTSAKVSAKEGAAAYVCFPWRTYTEFDQSMTDAGLDVSACIVWDKKHFGLGQQNYRPQHEFIFYSKGGSWFGDRSQSDVWSMSRGNTHDYVHPTQKPVELVERAVEHSSKKGDVVIDVFGGSGSTLIACEKTKRHARLMELDPKYCDVIVKRWQEFTGKKAVHAETGKTFDECSL